MNNEEFLNWLEADPMIEWTDEIIDRLSELSGVSPKSLYPRSIPQEEKPYYVRGVRRIAMRKAISALSG